jgi:hypothetical protein
MGNEENLAATKGRERGKPFVTTTHPHFVHSHIVSPRENHGILKVNYTVLSWFHSLMTCIPDHPIGVMLDADPNTQLGPHKVGNGNISVGDKQLQTIGFMSTGDDPSYHAFIASTPDKTASSTSLNPGNDPNANGSGDNRLGHALTKFGNKPNVCVLVPTNFESESGRNGPSTTVFYLNNKGAFLVRVGSIGREAAIELCRQQGVPFAGDVDGGAKIIKPYNHSAVLRGEEGMATAYSLIIEMTKIKDTFPLTANLMRELNALLYQWEPVTSY